MPIESNQISLSFIVNTILYSYVIENASVPFNFPVKVWVLSLWLKGFTCNKVSWFSNASLRDGCFFQKRLQIYIEAFRYNQRVHGNYFKFCIKSLENSNRSDLPSLISRKLTNVSISSSFLLSAQLSYAFRVQIFQYSYQSCYQS